jgi:hypothetical protein
MQKSSEECVPKTCPFSFEEVCYFLTGLPLPCPALMSQNRNHLRLTSEGCEATGKQDATFWWLTSPGTSAILRGVGCGCRRVDVHGEGRGQGERLQTLPFTSSLVAEHSSGERRSCLPRPSNQSLEQLALCVIRNSSDFYEVNP